MKERGKKGVGVFSQDDQCSIRLGVVPDHQEPKQRRHEEEAEKREKASGHVPRSLKRAADRASRALSGVAKAGPWPGLPAAGPDWLADGAS